MAGSIERFPALAKIVDSESVGGKMSRRSSGKDSEKANDKTTPPCRMPRCSIVVKKNKVEHAPKPNLPMVAASGRVEGPLRDTSGKAESRRGSGQKAVMSNHGESMFSPRRTIVSPSRKASVMPHMRDLLVANRKASMAVSRKASMLVARATSMRKESRWDSRKQSSCVTKEPMDMPASACGVLPIAKRQARLNNPQGRLTYLQEHEFFRGTTASFREKLAPQMVKRSGTFGSGNIIKQGTEPTGPLAYLFITGPDMHAKIEVSFDKKPIALLGSLSIFGMETTFGVSKRFLYDIWVPANAAGYLWVIPNSIVQSLLHKEAYSYDAHVLHENAHELAVSLFACYLKEHGTRVPLALFDSEAVEFKAALSQDANVRFYREGAVIQEEMKIEEECYCIFRGTASVALTDNSQTLFKLTQDETIEANETGAWWGVLQVLGVTVTTFSTVKAVTDCIVWRWSPDDLKELRRQFPIESNLIDEVGEQHMRLLQNYAVDMGVLAFADVEPETVRILAHECETCFYTAEETVFTQDEESDDLYFVARGRVSIRLPAVSCSLKRMSMAVSHAQSLVSRSKTEDHLTGSSRRSSVNRPPGGSQAMSRAGWRVLNTITEGNCFGEITCFGLETARTATAICDTLTQLRKIPHEVVLKAVERECSHNVHGLLDSCLEIVRKIGYKVQFDEDSWKELPFFHSFTDRFMSQLAASLQKKYAMKGQFLMDQDSDNQSLIILTDGTVAIEFDQKEFDTYEAPQVLGAMSAVISGSKNFYSSRCKSLCVYLYILSQNLHQIFPAFHDDEVAFRKAAKTNLEHFSTLLTRPSEHEKNILSTEANDDGGVGKDVEVFREVVCNFFKDSDPRFCDFLIQGMEKAIYFDGHEIFREGELGDYAIILHRGRVNVEVGGVRVGEVREGGLLGESILVSSKATTRTATVRTVGVVTAFKLAQAVVSAACEEFPKERVGIENMKKIRDQANKILVGDGPPNPSSNQLITASTMEGARRGSRSTIPAPSGEVCARRGSIALRMLSTVSAGANSESRTRRRAVITNEEPDMSRRGSNVLNSSTPANSLRRCSSANECIGRRKSYIDAAGVTPLLVGTSYDPRIALRNLVQVQFPLSSSDDEESRKVEKGFLKTQRKKCLAWASNLRKAKENAETRQICRQINAGRLCPIIPPDVGYVPPSSSRADSEGRAVDAWSRRDLELQPQSPPPWCQRLLKLRGIYERPVWSQVN